MINRLQLITPDAIRMSKFSICTPYFTICTPLYVLMFYCLWFDHVVRNNYSAFNTYLCLWHLSGIMSAALIGMSLTVVCTREFDGNRIIAECFIVRLKLRIKWKRPTTLGCHLDSVFCHSSKAPTPHYDAWFYRLRRAEDRSWTLV